MIWTKDEAKEYIAQKIKYLHDSGENIKLTEEGRIQIEKLSITAITALHLLVDSICADKNDKKIQKKLKLLCESINLIGIIVSEWHDIGSAKSRAFYIARSAKNIRDNDRNIELMDAISEEILKQTDYFTMAASDKYARIIRPGILKRLKIKEATENTLWPSVGTIKNRLLQIRQVKTKNVDPTE